MTHLNIVLTGFMGSGKTVVGQAVAERLGRWFVDMDAVIERAAGKPVSAIFAQDGEPAFRAMEAKMCRELAGERNLVIATGGGALVSNDNRAALEESGLLICLHAPVHVIIDRLGEAADRPLLVGPDRRERIEALLDQRAAAYAAIPHHIDTDGLTVEQVVERVIRLARRAGPGPVRIPVTYPGGGYDILLGDGMLAELGQAMLGAGLRPGRCAVVSQPAIIAAQAERLVEGLREAGFDPAVIEMPDGEAHKTLATVAGLYDAFVAAGLDRRSPVIALGGGVVGDVAGFAAASYLRGVPFVQAPTSLLAMVDASVGGKTGVDLPQGKNLVGAFKQPALVLIDPETLKTLPSDEFRSGLAEVVKHGMIGDSGLFEAMEGRRGEVPSPAPASAPTPSMRRGEVPSPSSARAPTPEGGGTPPLPLGDMIGRAVRVKVAVVEADPFEQGRRAALNLGHTFGHAFETLSGYQLRHGEAVGIGLAAATRLAARLDLCEPDLVERVERLLGRLGLPIRAGGFTPEQVMAAMATDKKRVGSRLRFVLPRAVGDVDLFDDVAPAAVLAVLAELVH
ncbi:MAG TPA: 3-dehydroquinate synthase [Anaerolineae bacterium]|nr:3-dehydroquinate synthase [Anaerolineae bacterium]